MAANRSLGGFASFRKLSGSTRDLELRLELDDPPASSYQRGALATGETQLESFVDPMLFAPDIDRLFADLEVTRHVSDLAAGVDQIQDPTPELGWIPAWSVLLALGHRDPTTELRQTGKTRMERLQ